jgi:anti-sigma-K factor RskA
LKKEEVEATWINHRLWRSLVVVAVMPMVSTMAAAVISDYGGN